MHEVEVFSQTRKFFLLLKFLSYRRLDISRLSAVEKAARIVKATEAEGFMWANKTLFQNFLNWHYLTYWNIEIQLYTPT